MTTKHASCDHPATSAARAACRRASGTLTAATTGRTDVHRPSVFQPEDYDFSHCGTYSSDDFLADVRRDAAQMMKIRRSEGWKADYESGRCSHCGTAITHYAIMLHVPSHTMIQIGETCLNGRFEMATAEFQNWRKMRAGNRAKAAKAEKLEAFLAANPRMRALLDYDGDNDFLSSLAEKLTSYAELSDRQVEAAEKALTRDRERAEARAAEAAATAHLAPLTAGKRTITGTLIHTKWQDSPFGYGASGSLKGLIQDDEGYKFWGTIPTAFQGDKGDTISITATIEPKEGEPTFAFYKRPRLA